MMIAIAENLDRVFDAAFSKIQLVYRDHVPGLMPREIGTITKVSTGTASVSGLNSVGFEELLKFPGGVIGIAFNVDEGEIGVVLLGDDCVRRPHPARDALSDFLNNPEKSTSTKTQTKE